MITKNVRALKNCTISTKVDDVKVLAVGEKTRIKFASETQYKALLAFGNFEEVHLPIPVNKIIRPGLEASVSQPNRTESKPEIKETVEGISSNPQQEMKIEDNKIYKEGPQPEGEPLVDEIDAPLTPGIVRNCSNCDSAMVLTGDKGSPEGNVRYWVCPICKKEEEEVNSLDTNEMFPCKVCGREFKTKGGLSLHINKIHVEVVKE